MTHIDWTTVDRVRQMLDVTPGSFSPDSLARIGKFVSAASRRLDTLLVDSTAVQSETLRRPVSRGRNPDVFMCPNSPVRSIQGARWSPSGNWTDAQSISDYQILPNLDGVIFTTTRLWGELELSYTGGWAFATETTIYAATATGTVTPGMTYSFSDGRQMTIVAFDGASLTFKPVVGTFVPTDVLVATGTVSGGIVTPAAGPTITMSAVIQESYANNFPEFEAAVCGQAAEWERRHSSLGKRSTTMGDGTTQFTGEYQLLKDFVDTLEPNKRVYGFM